MFHHCIMNFYEDEKKKSDYIETFKKTTQNCVRIKWNMKRDKRKQTGGGKVIHISAYNS